MFSAVIRHALLVAFVSLTVAISRVQGVPSSQLKCMWATSCIWLGYSPFHLLSAMLLLCVVLFSLHFDALPDV